MINQIKIGQFITECRKGLGFTQKELADQIGVTDKTVSKWETGNRLPDASLLMDLCMVLKVDVNELLKGERVCPEHYVQDAKDNLVDLVEEINGIKQEKAGRYLGTFIGMVSLAMGIVAVLLLSPGAVRLWDYVDISVIVVFLGILCLVWASAGCFHDYISAWKICIFQRQISEKEGKTAVRAFSFACAVILIVGKRKKPLCHSGGIFYYCVVCHGFLHPVFSAGCRGGNAAGILTYEDGCGIAPRKGVCRKMAGKSCCLTNILWSGALHTGKTSLWT